MFQVGTLLCRVSSATPRHRSASRHGFSRTRTRGSAGTSTTRESNHSRRGVRSTRGTEDSSCRRRRACRPARQSECQPHSSTNSSCSGTYRGDRWGFFHGRFGIFSIARYRRRATTTSKWRFGCLPGALYCWTSPMGVQRGDTEPVRITCPACGSRLIVEETASGGRTVFVTQLSTAVDASARAFELFLGPDDGPNLRCPPCQAVFDPRAPRIRTPPISKGSSHSGTR